MNIEEMETSKSAIKAYLEDASSDTKSELQSGKAMRLAVLRFILDTLKVTDAETRKAAAKQFLATPGWFGCNASAARQAYGIAAKSGEVENYIDTLEV